MHTGISPAAWEAEGGRTIQTALELLAEQGRRGHDDRPQMSG